MLSSLGCLYICYQFSVSSWVSLPFIFSISWWRYKLVFFSFSLTKDAPAPYHLHTSFVTKNDFSTLWRSLVFWSRDQGHERSLVLSYSGVISIVASSIFGLATKLQIGQKVVLCTVMWFPVHAYTPPYHQWTTYSFLFAMFISMHLVYQNPHL
jgi:hypothetical protein